VIAARRIGEQREDIGGQLRRGACRGEQAGRVVVDDFGDASAARADHGELHRHGFEQGDG
jgi:hypothetical protein